MDEHVRWTLTITWNAFCRPPGYCRRCWFPWDSKTLNPSPKPKQKKTRTQCLAKKTSLVATSGLGRTWRHKIDWKKHEKGNPDSKHALAMHFKTSQRPSPCFAGTAQDFWSILSRLDGLFPRCFMLFPVSPPLWNWECLQGNWFEDAKYGPHGITCFAHSLTMFRTCSNS